MRRRISSGRRRSCNAAFHWSSCSSDRIRGHSQVRHQKRWLSLLIDHLLHLLLHRRLGPSFDVPFNPFSSLFSSRHAAHGRGLRSRGGGRGSARPDHQRSLPVHSPLGRSVIVREKKRPTEQQHSIELPEAELFF